MQVKKVRFIISCLSLVASLAILAAPAFAQGVAFQASSLPQQVRIEGLTETVGAVVLQATGSGTIPTTSSITLLYSGTITGSTLTAAVVSGAFGGTSCGAGTCTSHNGTASFAVAATGNQLTVSVPSTGTNATFSTGDYIVISQVRVNIAALGSGVTTVSATLSGTSAAPTTNPITFTQSTVPVASVVSPSLTFAVGAASNSLSTCNLSSATFTVTVGERYPAALTSLTDESGFTPSYPPHNGTSLAITVTGVPSGLTVAYTGYSTNSTSVNLTFSALATSAATVTSTGAPITFTIPVATTSTSTTESAVFGFTVSSATTSITPLGTTVTVTAGASLTGTGPVVTFGTNSYGPSNVLSIGDCVTNLLFPFITNQVGFDTSIQIANTTANALAFGSGVGANPQSGTCQLTFYPTDLTTQTGTAAGANGTVVQATTPSIAAGGVYSFLQSTSTFANQSGYMFAVCRFLDAHAFSFVMNGNASTATISQGLLALVITSTSNQRLSNANYESLTH